jgi:hypothetical protein
MQLIKDRSLAMHAAVAEQALRSVPIKKLFELNLCFGRAV